MKYFATFAAAAALMIGAASIQAQAGQYDFGVQTHNNATSQTSFEAPQGD